MAVAAVCTVIFHRQRLVSLLMLSVGLMVMAFAVFGRIWP
jgi:hypothetical protein